ncbi:hypothetical protein [Alkalicoccobacillus murimartini]|uniref:Low affinity Fe/Cu permease n=1 Tax=Alkalicoccobacillus murimartini TaxID=171685 RepID=A0ABT9YHD2_9BACI|nr:hypothetical protein [Alkalicoccobacillus murimartini]MDQ0206926.1 low affinity Fe/Cu permease [Alkalicoccobacillus murimartini]
MKQLGLWVAVSVFTTLFLIAGCNNAVEEPIDPQEENDQEEDSEQRYVESLVLVERDLKQVQEAVFQFLDGLMENGHYVNALIHIKEKQEQLDRQMVQYLDQTTSEGVPEPYLELHINLLNLKRNHEQVTSFNEIPIAEEEFVTFVKEFDQRVQVYDHQLAQYEDKALEGDLTTGLQTYEQRFDEKDYTISDVTGRMLGLQIDEYMNVFQGYVHQFKEEQVRFTDSLSHMEEVGLEDLTESEIQELSESLQNQRVLVEAFLNEPYPESAEDLHSFFDNEVAEFRDVNVLMVNAVEVRNELLVQEALNKLADIWGSIGDKQQEMEQLIDTTKESIALESEGI